MASVVCFVYSARWKKRNRFNCVAALKNLANCKNIAAFFPWYFLQSCGFHPDAFSPIKCKKEVVDRPTTITKISSTTTSTEYMRQSHIYRSTTKSLKIYWINKKCKCKCKMSGPLNSRKNKFAVMERASQRCRSIH